MDVIDDWHGQQYSGSEHYYAVETGSSWLHFLFIIHVFIIINLILRKTNRTSEYTLVCMINKIQMCNEYLCTILRWIWNKLVKISCWYRLSCWHYGRLLHSSRSLHRAGCRWSACLLRPYSSLSCFRNYSCPGSHLCKQSSTWYCWCTRVRLWCCLSWLSDLLFRLNHRGRGNIGGFLCCISVRVCSRTRMLSFLKTFRIHTVCVIDWSIICPRNWLSGTASHCYQKLCLLYKNPCPISM